MVWMVMGAGVAGLAVKVYLLQRRVRAIERAAKGAQYDVRVAHKRLDLHGVRAGLLDERQINEVRDELYWSTSELLEAELRNATQPEQAAVR